LPNQLRLLNGCCIPKLIELIEHKIVHLEVCFNAVNELAVCLFEVILFPSGIISAEQDEKLQIGLNTFYQFLNYILGIWLESALLVCDVFDVKHLKEEKLV
jgi:hypothetical protein